MIIRRIISIGLWALFCGKGKDKLFSEDKRQKTPTTMGGPTERIKYRDIRASRKGKLSRQRSAFLPTEKALGESLTANVSYHKESSVQRYVPLLLGNTSIKKM